MKNMLLKWILGNSGLGLMVLDPHMNIVEINEWILEKAQLKRNDVTGKPVQEIFPEIAERNHLKYLHASMNGQPQVLAGSFHKYFLKLKRDGAETEEWMIQSTTITPMMDGKKISGISILITDVTERTINEERISETIRELRESNEKIRLSEALFRTTLYSIGDAVITTDKNGNIRQMNPIAEQLTGWSEAESAGRWLGDVFVIKSELTGLPVESPVTIVLREGKIVGLANHTLLVTKQGDEIPIADSGAPIINAAGEITGVVLVFHDQIKEHEFLRTLADSEAKFRSLVESSNDGISLMDIEGNILFANQGKIEMLGYDSPVDLIGVNAYSLIEETERQKFFELAPKFLEQGFLANTETRAIRKDGSVVDVEINFRMINDENGQPAFIMDTIRDISERKRAEAKLQREQALYMDLVNALPAGMYRLNVKPVVKWSADNWRSQVESQYVVDFVSDRFCEITGIDRQEFIANPGLVPDRIHPDDSLEFTHKNAAAILSLSMFSWEGRMIVPDKGTTWIRFESIPRAQENGEVIWTGIVYDISERKQAEEILKESEDRFRDLVENSNDLICTHDLVGNIITANNAAFLTTGYSEEELMNLNMQDVVAPEYRRIFKAYLKKIKKTGKAKGHLIIQTKTGERRIWEYNNSLRTNVIDKPIVRGMARDITEEKRAEESLQISERRLDLFFSQSLAGFFFMMLDEPIRWDDTVDKEKVLDYVFTHQRVTKINKAMLKQYRASEEQFLNHTPNDFFAHDLDGGRKVWSDLFDRGKYHVDTQEKRLDGSEMIVEGDYICIYDSHGRITGLFGVQNDVTEFRNNEAALFDSEERYRTIVSNIPGGIIHIIDRDMKYVFNAGEELIRIGLSNEFLVGKSIYEVLSAELAPVIEAQYRRVLAGETVKFEGGFGDDYYSMTSSPLKNAHGKIENILTLSVNITERKQAEQEILQLNENLERRVIERTAQLEVSNKELEAFSYSVSHDLRAPLRHINGYVELLNNQFKDELPEKAHHYLETISGASNQMGVLIDELLKYSRTGQKEVSKAALDFNALLKDVLEEMTPVTKGREITWNIQELPKVYGDYNLLKLVWTNLLDNAIKYTRNQQTAKISVGYKKEAKDFVFFVCDNGVGFDMKYAHKLFGVFQRLHSKAEFEGTGIGLANVQRIVHKHMGRVWAEAKPGKGAKFYFSLPIILEKIR